MRESGFLSPAHKESSRQCINDQIKEYLAQGGKIDKIEKEAKHLKPVGQAWRQRVGSFEI